MRKCVVIIKLLNPSIVDSATPQKGLALIVIIYILSIPRQKCAVESSLKFSKNGQSVCIFL